MNGRLYLSIAVLCVCGVMTGCASVTQGTKFQPPTGWTGTPSIFGRAQMWMKTGKTKDEMQFLMLVKGDPNKMHTDFSSVPSNVATDMKDVSQSDVKFCGTQPGQEFRAIGTDKNGKRSQLDMTTAVIGNDRYMAMYIRPAAGPVDAQAETAIHSLCPL
jgi:hypothetical protein